MLSPLNVRDPSSSCLVTVREEGSEAVSRPLAIVWPCPLPVDAYVAAGRDVEVPRPVCPSCAGPLVFWSGYGGMSGPRAAAGRSSCRGCAAAGAG